MIKRVMICGVDCYPGDENCNGYCQGKVDSPPEATKEQKTKWAKHSIHEKLKELEILIRDFYIECEPHNDTDKEDLIALNNQIKRMLSSF